VREFTPRDFTVNQLAAIEYLSKDACVVAGPGSGKTTVLVERYRLLVERHRIDPHRILAVTFTEKAAANMKAKLAEQFRHNDVLLRDVDSGWVSTIHGFCARLLRENAIAAGIDPRFVVLDAREADDLQFACLNEALDELMAERREEGLALIATLQEPWIAGDLKNAYDGIRSAGKTVEDVRAMASPNAGVTPQSLALRLVELLRGWPEKITPLQATQRAELIAWSQTLATANAGTDVMELIKSGPWNMRRVPQDEKKALEALRDALSGAAVDAHTAPFRQIIFEVLARFDELYRERKKERGALDFNDLERRAIELLCQNQEVGTRIRTHFRQIMLDEYQDINRQQEQLIGLIRGEDVFFAVGDINQSIYGFRHARPDIFLGYQAEIEENGKHKAELFDNFRSREEILRCVEALLNGAEGIEHRALRAGKGFSGKTRPSIEILRVLEESEDKDEAGRREARWIAQRIARLSEELPARFGDFAVLCRNSESMTPILTEFDRAGIPYVCGRRQSFLLSREGLDITALLKTIANPRDAIALATVLRSNLVGLGDEALLRLRLLATSLTSGLNMAARDAALLSDFAEEDRIKLERFTADLKRWRGDQPVVPLDVLMVRMLGDCGFQLTPGSLLGDNVEAFLQLARTKGAELPLVDFLRELESMEDAVSTESELSDEDQGNRVQVMTAHAAKGLEFRVTIIAAMHKGTQRESAPVTFTPEHGLGIKWKDPSSKDGMKDSWARANSERLKQREREESNRLLYVAMTRAEEHLILSYTCAKRLTNWARLVDDFFQSTPEPEGFEVSVVDADSDPPLADLRAVQDGKTTDVLTLARPHVGDQHDTAVNVTSLAVFSSCPRKYYLQRYIGWNTRRFARFDPESLPEEDDETDLDAAELGSLVHEVLAGKAGPHPAEAHKLANVFLESDLGRRAAQATRAAREWDFIADIDDTLVRGTIDLWFEENGEIHLVDYKTDAVARPADYAPQLALYALAMERAFGKRPAHAWLHFLRSDLVVEVPLNDATLDNARQLIADLREAQDRLQFDLRVGAHCESCQFFRSICPAGLGHREQVSR
jgi:ATP-dependent exoDNAse (exonuclease V) beta subunit